ncbi:hypothetical protein M3J43_26795, partial [Escherichia coli]|nr:hypothetical protein [Escherichia coli]
AMRSQGVEPSTKCFCSMHELAYETKAMSKEQYHNNLAVMDLLPAPMQVIWCQHTEKGGLEPGWRNGFT